MKTVLKSLAVTTFVIASLLSCHFTSAQESQLSALTLGDSGLDEPSSADGDSGEPMAQAVVAANRPFSAPEMDPPSVDDEEFSATDRGGQNPPRHTRRSVGDASRTFLDDAGSVASRAADQSLRDIE